MRLGDALIAAFTGLVTFMLVIGPVTSMNWNEAGALALATFATPLFVQAADAYQTVAFSSRAGQLGRTLGAWTILFAGFAVLAIFFDVGDAADRRWFGVWFGLGAAVLLIERVALGSFIRRWAQEARLGRKAVIVGGGENAGELIRALESASGNDVHICGVFDDRSNERSPASVAGYPKLGNVAELLEFARIARVDLLIVTIPISAKGRVAEILKTLWVLPVDIRLSAHTEKLRFRPRAYSYVGKVPMVALAARPIQNWDIVMKRAFDLVVGGLALLLASPFMLATAIAIKLDSPGAVFFRQKRYGFNNEVIDVFKFRSMYADRCDPEAKVAVTRGDNRVTRVGRFIRKSSLDELPQLFNVLRGELSLVGPRPHAVNAHTSERLWNDVVDGYFARHRVKPGVTGWAQVNGWRGEVDTPAKLQNRVDHDLYYIENWSILFDIIILARTPFALAKAENAF
ncbi:undecaprenyl-phosphate glucose phosphotransferase [Hansschlegelia quercus]|uniref:Undecaprenyl-phosphate glucose phosphotransferase n=2 Tax=Hansschlegelia quercus TaxID=2528245 RepID=A0A4Q9GJQ4_9HYPH|nr:undecaprenyl-phosphate glucose phosphotransferase [Hansschlegelia quercus]